MCDICKLEEQKNNTFIDLESYQELEQQNTELKEQIKQLGFLLIECKEMLQNFVDATKEQGKEE